MRHVLQILYSMLDSKDDVRGQMGTPDEERLKRPKLRFNIVESRFCNTRVIMDAKVWSLKALKLVYTMQLDMRVSLMISDFTKQYVEQSSQETAQFAVSESRMSAHCRVRSPLRMHHTSALTVSSPRNMRMRIDCCCAQATCSTIPASTSPARKVSRS